MWTGIGATSFTPPSTTTTSTWVKGTDAGTGNDWTAPWKDDDETDPFCTPNSSDENDVFACKKILCLIQREMDTGDANDFKFSTKDGENVIYIAPGRAILGINDQSISTAEWQYSYGLLRSMPLKREIITIR